MKLIESKAEYIPQGEGMFLTQVFLSTSILLLNEGYKFTSYSNSDFYSDDLRFAGFTEFS